jgi:hypothetical protein
MNLIVFNYEGKYTPEFIFWLIRKIRDYFLININSDKLINLQSNEDYKNIDLFSCLIQCFNSLQYRKYPGKYVIQVNPNTIISQPRAKLIEVCKYITYGTLNIKGYPIVLDIFKYFAENLDEFLEEFQNERL